MTRMKYGAIIATALLYGCGAADGDPGPGGVTVEDTKALDAAAAKLDAETQADTPAADTPTSESE